MRFLFCAAFLLATKLIGTEMPNILLITADSLRAKNTSVHGYARATTPNLKKLSERGVTFLNHFSSSGWTSESILSLLLSQTSVTHKVIAKDLSLPAGSVTPLTILADRGYEIPKLESKLVISNYFHLGFQGELIKSPPIQWIEASRKKRFFVWLHLMQTHLPYKAPPDFLNHYLTPDMLKDADTRERVQLVQTARIIKRDSVPFVAKDLPALTAVYDAGVEWMDSELGKILNELDRLKLTQNTLVLFTADHGEELLERGNIGHVSTQQGGHLHDELIHVPLVLSLPGKLPAKLQVRAQVSSLDVMPTVFELLGISKLSQFEGHSLMPLIRGEETDDRTHFASTSYKGYQEEDPRKVTHFFRTVRRPPWKYYREEKNGSSKDQLFHLAKDPGETKNVILSHPKIASELKAELEKRLKR